MRVVNIALLGFGNVGSGVYEIIKRNRNDILQREGIDFNVKKILVRDINKTRKDGAPKEIFTDKFEDILNDTDIEIVAEFLGGTEPSRNYLINVLRHGKSVVTANKEVLSKYWPELEDEAMKHKVGLYYEASVAGGIPVIKAVQESLQANKISEIMGIINGTTNFILTKMSDEGQGYNETLKEAQNFGYAEPDPTADVEGFDALYKLSILSSISFHKRVGLQSIYREGISKISAEDIEYGKELGFALKLLAISKNNGETIEARVHPTFLPVSHPLASVRDSYNAIFIKGDAVGNLMFYGRGAGDLPTGSAVVSDIISAARNKGFHKYSTFSNVNDSKDDAKVTDDWKCEYFLRFLVNDKPGVLAKIAGILGKYEVSIASVIQKNRSEKSVPLVFVTHMAWEKSLNNAIDEIKKLEEIDKIESVIRVER
jgi:homoserine dehydrogenase